MPFKIKNLCGYTANMKPMRAGKIENSINNKRVKFTFVGESVASVANIAEWIVNDVLGLGYKPTENIITHGYQYVYTIHGREKLWCKYDNPKTEYVLKNPVTDIELAMQLNKSQYDFAVWVMENFRTLDDALKADADYTEKLNKAKEEAEKQEQAEIEAEQRAKQAKEQYKVYAMSKSEKLIDTKICELYVNTMKKIYGEDYRVYLNGLMLYVCAEEIENPLAKDMLVNWLNNHNKGSIKFFEIIAGVKLPKTYKARVEFINQLTADKINLMEI